jgi:hypothetical protein
MLNPRGSSACAIVAAVALIAGFVVPPAGPPAFATGIKLPKFAGAAPGQVSCAVSFAVTFVPPLTASGGGSNPSIVSAGKSSACAATTSSATISTGKFTGSFAATPIDCHDALTGASAALGLTWTGSVNGAVTDAPRAIAYAGTAKLAPSQVAGAASSGSFAGPATIALDPPSAGVVAAGCGGSKGLKKLALTGTITLGSPTPPTILPTSWWTPPLGNVPWQWELDHALVVTKPTDMGAGATLPNGDPAPDPAVYDIDGIDNSAATVAALHAGGDHAVCYVEVGSAGNYYSAAAEGLGTTYYNQFKLAGVVGKRLSSYPEYFLNVDAPATVDIVEDMIAQQCYAKGFDAVETDLDETYDGNEGATGFTITRSDEQTYLTTLADFMHSLGLGWVAKNLDDTGDDFATVMEPVADGMLTEQCNQYGSCDALSSYVGVKAVFNAEYSAPTSAFCAADDALGFNGERFPVSLNGRREPCR